MPSETKPQNRCQTIKGINTNAIAVFNHDKRSIVDYGNISPDQGHFPSPLPRYSYPRNNKEAAMNGYMQKWNRVSVIESILLVDGEATTRSAMKFMLELNGYRVVEAHHGIEALQVLNEWGGDIQLALCGAELPDMTGPEWLSQLRFLGPEVPALLLSEKESVEVAEMAVGPAYGGMPAKPPAPARLLERIRRALDEHFFSRCERATAA
jgi:CheY-like chemotaxis protein